MILKIAAGRTHTSARTTNGFAAEWKRANHAGSVPTLAGVAEPSRNALPHWRSNPARRKAVIAARVRRNSAVHARKAHCRTVHARTRSRGVPRAGVGEIDAEFLFGGCSG